MKMSYLLQDVTFRFMSMGVLLLCMAMETTTHPPMKRKDLLQTNFKSRLITSVKIVEVEFPAGQKGPYHKHPCPVMGYIVEGSCLLQVEGEPPRILKAGEAFYEPAETPILHFDNYSDTMPLKFVAHYLLNGEKELIKIIPQKNH